jgi:hypothetical protein
MKHLSTLLLGLLAALTLAWGLAASPAIAATRQQTTGPTGSNIEPIDVVVLLDDSGSMATCWPWPEQGTPFSPPCQFPSPNEPSDPNELRYSAARLLVEMADEEDRVAVVRFDSQAEGIGGLGALQQAGSAENRRRLADTLQPPTNYLIRGYTRIDLGLQEAARLLQTSRQPGRNQYILLLTDGEPTQPLSAGSQRPRVAQQVQELREAGVLVFPVVLCNPTSGCAGEFLRAQFDREGVREATSAQALLQVFSEIFAQMKSDRSIVTERNVNGDLQFLIRDVHGARSATIVSTRAGLAAVRKDDSPVVTRTLLTDDNIQVSVVQGDPLPPGRWVAETKDFGAFAVIQADSYPELLFPPPSALDSPASVRYYPAGKPPILLAKGVGPAANEPLLLNGSTPLLPFGKDSVTQEPVYGLPLSIESDEVTIQLGEDSVPLQLRRTYRLQGRSDLPRLQVFSPTADDLGLLEDGSIHLQVGFGPGLPVQDLVASVFVTDNTDDADGRGRPVYRAAMSCVDRLCTNDAFQPADGRTYRVRYLVSAYTDGVRFGDWAQADWEMEPAVYLRGVPASLDLAKMPPDGWPVSVVAGTTEEIGTLAATLTLRRADTGEIVPEAGLDFVIDVPEAGSQEARLRVDGLELLRPGDYTGELMLSVTNPAGLPMNVKIRPAPVIPVSLKVSRSAARLQAQNADFGEIPFDTSPNFRVDEELLLPISFAQDKTFQITAELVESSCPGLQIVAGDYRREGGNVLLPLRLQSLGPIQPGTCQGRIRLRGPNEDFDVFPGEVEYLLRIAGLEWAVVSSELSLGNLGRAGERASDTLLIRYEGKTPFTLQMIGLEVSGVSQDTAIQLSDDFVEMLPVEVTGPPDENGLYHVPITLVARKAIPSDPVRGTFYSGDLELGIVGLEVETRSVGVNFRSPTLIQRYIEPWLVPIYSLPWVICTGPLTLLLLLIVVARVRGRNYVEEPEPTVVLPQVEPQLTFSQPTAGDVFAEMGEGAPGEDEAWSSEWSEGVWRSDEETVSEALSSTADNRSANEPWDTDWQ